MFTNQFSRGCLISAIFVALTGCSQTAGPNQGTGAQLGSVAGSSTTENLTSTDSRAAKEKAAAEVPEQSGKSSNAGSYAFFGVMCVLDFITCPIVVALQAARSSQIASYGGTADDIRDASPFRYKLSERDEVLALVKDGKIVATTRNSPLPHKEAVHVMLGVPLGVGAETPLVRMGKTEEELVKSGEVVVIRKLPSGEITAFRSKEFYGKEVPASPAAIDAAREKYSTGLEP